MNWQKIVADLARHGWTQSRIADECGVRQSTVSDLARKTASPRFDTGAKLLALHAKHVPARGTKKQRAVAA